MLSPRLSHRLVLGLFQPRAFHLRRHHDTHWTFPLMSARSADWLHLSWRSSRSDGEMEVRLSFSNLCVAHTFMSSNRYPATMYVLIAGLSTKSTSRSYYSDFKQDFNLSFLTSSLFWVASFSGCAVLFAFSLPSLTAPLFIYTRRYWVGTIFVEHITRFLGLGMFSTGIKPRVFPRIRRRWLRNATAPGDSVVGFSPAQSRFLTRCSRACCIQRSSSLWVQSAVFLV